MPTEVQLAYVAGILDGEGSIQLSRHTQGQMQPQVRIFNTDIGMLKFVQSVVGGNIHTHADCRPGHNNPVYRLCWSCRRGIIKVLEQVEPYLIVKKPQAQLLLAWCKIRQAGNFTKDNNYAEEISAINGGALCR